MASIDNLPADQRAVLELVLRRGRSYDEIASLLSIDRAGVRQRALAALDALGPKTRVRADRRALITDYLLDALPAEVAGEVRDHLSGSANERAWARAVASELQPLSEQPLPEIPSNGRGPQPKARVSKRPAGTRERAPKAEVPVVAALSNGAPRERSPQRVSSRVGGAVLLGLAAAVAIALVLVFVVLPGGGKAHKHPAANTAAAHRSTTTTAASTAKITSQVVLRPPSGAKSPLGLAEVITLQGKTGVAIAAEGLAPNKTKPKDYYAVWLANGPSSSTELLGVASTPVKHNGVLRTAGGLPTNASSFHTLVLTLETSANPKAPGRVVLLGSGKL